LPKKRGTLNVIQYAVPRLVRENRADLKVCFFLENPGLLPMIAIQASTHCSDARIGTVGELDTGGAGR